MEHLEEKVAAHEAILGQMNERLGAIEATLREINTRLLTMAASSATRSEMQWGIGLGVGWLTTIIVIAVGVLLKYR